MNFEIQFIGAKDYFIIKTIGETSPAGIKDSLEKVFANPGWHNGARILFDNRLEILDNLTSDGVKAISNSFIQFNEKLNGSKVAVVMPQDLAYGFGRMWQMHTDIDAQFETSVFRNIEEATRWIEE
jgi:hypothetical protein